MPEKKIAIEKKSDAYQKVTTISIINNEDDDDESEKSMQKTTDKKKKNEGVESRHETTTEYEIKIQTTHNPNDYDEIDYDQHHYVNHTEFGFEEPFAMDEEDNLTQIITYENSIIEKSDDSRDLDGSYLTQDEDDQAIDETNRKTAGSHTDLTSVCTSGNELVKSAAVASSRRTSSEKRGGGVEKDVPLGGVPQTLISCLNELQSGGNLISWKITGQGENLTVKITWSNEQKMRSSRHLLSKSFLEKKGRMWQLGNSVEYEELNELFSRDDIFELIRGDLSDFRSKFKSCIKLLLNELSQKEQSRTRTFEEYETLFFNIRNSLKSTLLDSNHVLQLKLNGNRCLKSKTCNRTSIVLYHEDVTPKDRLKKLIRLILVNEVEKSVKVRSGRILKDVELNATIDSNFSFEDFLSSFIVEKYVSKRKIVYGKNEILRRAELDLDMNESREESNSRRIHFSGYTSGKPRSSSRDVYELKSGREGSRNEELLKFENGVVLTTYKRKDSDVDIGSNVSEKVDSEWQENWSFIGKSNKTYSLDISLNEKNKNMLTQRPVTLIVPQPKSPIYPTIGDDEIAKLSNSTIPNAKETETVAESIQEKNQSSDDSETKTFKPVESSDMTISLDQEANASEEITPNTTSTTASSLNDPRFPIPVNMLISKRASFKSSSYYKSNADERLESETDTDTNLSASNPEFATTAATQSVTQPLALAAASDLNEKNRISPKLNLTDPRFEVRPTDRLIRQGETVKFSCRVAGSKPLEVFWYKMNGDELINDEKYEIYHDDECHYLKIYNTNQLDVGLYLCVISNELDQNVDSFYLKLRENNRMFRPPRFLSALQDLELEEGKSALFEIKIDFGYPKARVLFYKNQSIIKNDKHHQIYYSGDGVYQIHVPNLTDEDNAQYTCVAVNSGGRIESNAELYVLEKEKINKIESLVVSRRASSSSVEKTDEQGQQVTDVIGVEASSIRINVQHSRTSITEQQDPKNQIKDVKMLANSTEKPAVSAFKPVIKSTTARSSSTSSLVNKVNLLNKSTSSLDQMKTLRSSVVTVKTSSSLSRVSSVVSMAGSVNDNKETPRPPSSIKDNRTSSPKLDVSGSQKSFIKIVDRKLSFEKKSHSVERLNEPTLSREEFVQKIDSNSLETDRVLTESVKKLKNLWEFQILTSKPSTTTNTKLSDMMSPVFTGAKSSSAIQSKIKSRTKSSIVDVVKSSYFPHSQDLKKWVSLEIINQNESFVSIIDSPSCSTDQLCLKSTCTSLVLPHDQNRSTIQVVSVPAAKEADTQQEHADDINLDDKLVKKLKEKFENKDQAFVKKASLTCRNVSYNEGALSRKLASSMQILDSSTNSQTKEIEEEIKKPASVPTVLRRSDSVDSLSQMNISLRKKKSNKTDVRGFPFQPQELQDQHNKLKKVNSVSSNSVASSGQSSGAATDHEPVTKNTSALNSQTSFTKEIKSLLEIAENRAKLLCKVYDSSLNDQENEAQQNLRLQQTQQNQQQQQPQLQRQLLPDKLKLAGNKSQLLPARPSDYKSIINANYLNSTKKSSHVINKVKLWDQLLQSGRVNGDKWHREFV